MGLLLLDFHMALIFFFWHQFLWGELRPYKAHISLKSSELLRLTFIGKSWNHTSSLNQMINEVIHAANLFEVLFARCHSCQCEYFGGQTDRSLSLGSARVPKGIAMSVLLIGRSWGGTLQVMEGHCVTFQRASQDNSLSPRN